MCKLKVYLQKLDKHIIFQILEQDINSALLRVGVNFQIESKYLDGTRVNVYVDFYQTSKPTIRIGNRSYSEKPNRKEVSEGYRNIVFFLRGDRKDKDKSVISIPFHNNEVRDSVYDDLIKSLKEFKTRYE